MSFASFKNSMDKRRGQQEKPYYLNDPEWLANKIPERESFLNESGFAPPSAKKGKRTTLDRFLGAVLVGQYTTQGGINSVLNGGKFSEGAMEGAKAANPFGEGYEKGETSFADIMETLGVEKPTTTKGKIAHGVADFAGSTLLDPTTYLTLGTGAIVKGGAKAIGRASLRELSKKTVASTASKKVANKLFAEAEKGNGSILQTIMHNPKAFPSVVEKGFVRVPKMKKVQGVMIPDPNNMQKVKISEPLHFPQERQTEILSQLAHGLVEDLSPAVIEGTLS